VSKQSTCERSPPSQRSSKVVQPPRVANLCKCLHRSLWSMREEEGLRERHLLSLVVVTHHRHDAIGDVVEELDASEATSFESVVPHHLCQDSATAAAMFEGRKVSPEVKKSLPSPGQSPKAERE
jgi:hypothetical protein